MTPENQRVCRELIAHCLTFTGVYLDYPFGEAEWAALRCRGNSKTLAFIYERNGKVWVNLKCAPEWGDFWRGVYEAVTPAYHMNKKHWISVVMDGSVPRDVFEQMLYDSFRLVRPKGAL